LEKANEGREGYRNELIQAESEELKVQHAFLDSQNEANRFFKTVMEEI
jgi:uncharacterized protein YqeY